MSKETKLEYRFIHIKKWQGVIDLHGIMEEQEMFAPSSRKWSWEPVSPSFSLRLLDKPYL